MRLLIFIESIEGGRFRARAGEPFSLSAEGGTADEAAQQLAAALNAILKRGRLAIITLENGTSTVSTPSPFPADDLYKTDWAFRELQEAMAENRRQEEALDP